MDQKIKNFLYFVSACIGGRIEYFGEIGPGRWEAISLCSFQLLFTVSRGYTPFFKDFFSKF